MMATYIYSYWEIFSQGKHDALLASGVAIYKKFEQIFLTLRIFQKKYFYCKFFDNSF